MGAQQGAHRGGQRGGSARPPRGFNVHGGGAGVCQQAPPFMPALPQRKHSLPLHLALHGHAPLLDGHDLLHQGLVAVAALGADAQLVHLRGRAMGVTTSGPPPAPSGTANSTQELPTIFTV